VSRATTRSPSKRRIAGLTQAYARAVVTDTKNCPVQTDSLFSSYCRKENAVYRMFPRPFRAPSRYTRRHIATARIACPAGVNPMPYVKLLAAARCRKPLMSSTRLCPLPESAAGSAIIPAKQNAIEASSWGACLDLCAEALHL